jgi:hypothetical protein
MRCQVGTGEQSVCLASVSVLYEYSRADQEGDFFMEPGEQNTLPLCSLAAPLVAKIVFVGERATAAEFARTGSDDQELSIDIGSAVNRMAIDSKSARRIKGLGDLHHRLSPSFACTNFCTNFAIQPHKDPCTAAYNLQQLRFRVECR